MPTFACEPRVKALKIETKENFKIIVHIQYEAIKMFCRRKEPLVSGIERQEVGRVGPLAMRGFSATTSVKIEICFRPSHQNRFVS